jgi:hypothetical protein
MTAEGISICGFLVLMVCLTAVHFIAKLIECKRGK